MTEVHVPVQASDEVLLARYVRDRDRTAFAELVSRHAPLVWSVCRRIVGQHHSAEDAFQATFVVLMQQAPRLTLRARLGSWLYAVAVKVARRTQARDTRQAPQSLNTPTSTKPVEQLTVQELIAIVREEVGRLPRRYQPVMDLCYLQQQLISDVAERLGLTTGTIRGMLQRGRKLLEERLLHRGIAPLALASISLTTLLADPLPSATLHATQAMALGRVPEQLTKLTQVSNWSLQPGLAGVTVIVLALAGLGWSLLELRAATPSNMTFPHISQLNPTKPVADVCGYVDDNDGKPLAGVKVEVYLNRQLETTLTTDHSGRFDIPEAWKHKNVQARWLLVRHGKTLGWSDRLSRHQDTVNDVMIKVLPLTAEVQAEVVLGKGGKVLAESRFWIVHDINGGFSNDFVVPESLELLPARVNNNTITYQVPIQTNGMVFVSGEGHITRRMRYHARDTGKVDVGTITLAHGASIVGTLRDPDGRPIAGAKLFAQMNDEQWTGGIIEDGTGCHTISDAHGKYTLHGLDARCSFNVMLTEPVKRAKYSSPLVLKAPSGVKVEAGKSTTVDLQLQPGRIVKGQVVTEGRQPLQKVIGIGCKGSARPQSSGGIESTWTKENGSFEFCVPPGSTMFYCNDGQWDGNTTVGISASEEVPLVTLELKPRKLEMYYVPKSTMGINEFSHASTQPVQAQGDKVVESQSLYFDQLFTLVCDSKAPAIIHYRVYRNNIPLDSTHFLTRMYGTMTVNAKHIIVRLPYLPAQEIVVEVDAGGFAPQYHTMKATHAESAVPLKLIPSPSVPITCLVRDQRQQAVSNARLQVELKRLGTTIDAPWGPILQSDASGRCKIEHLRVGDVYRVRVFGQNGQTAVTEWQTMKEKPEELKITLSR